MASNGKGNGNNDSSDSNNNNDTDMNNITVPENGNIATPQGVVQAEIEMTQLQFYVECEQWQEVSARLKTHSSEICGSCKHMNALHLALEGGECPFAILREMIELEPLAVAQLDGNGNTPLHTACAGEFAYDPLVISMLLAAYPQAILMQEHVERSTPLHMLLVMGGDVNLTCLQLLLDVAYSQLAGLPTEYVLALEFLSSSLELSVQIAQHYPPRLTRVVCEMAASDPYTFPAFLRPFLHLPLIHERQPSTMSPNQPNLLLIKDSSQQVPLNVACRKALSKGVAELLLDDQFYPGAHQACHALERRNRYPLHYACIYGMPPEATKLVYRHNKAANYHYEEYGMTPTELIANNPTCILEDRAMAVTKRRTSPSESIEPFFVRPKGYMMFVLLRTMCQVTFDESRDSTLHAASAVPSSPHFMRTAIALFPWQISERDEDGNLPIHYASAVERPHGICEHHYWMSARVDYNKIGFRLHKEDRFKDNPIAILLGEYPHGASCLDRRGNLPLHLAVLSGKKMRDGVLSLIAAAPMALSTRNLVHRLYPFQLAAIGDVNDLTVVYELLLANPSVVASGVHNADTPPATKKAKCSGFSSAGV